MLRRIFPILCIVIFVTFAGIAACQVAAPTATAPNPQGPASARGDQTSPSGTQPQPPVASPVASPVPSPVPEVRLRIARPDSPIAALALTVAQSQRFLADQRITIDVQNLEPEDALEALSKGERDIAIIPVSVLLTATNANEFAVVAGVINKSLDVLVVGPQIQSWADLRSGVIAARRADDLSASLAVKLLDAHGEKRADVSIFGITADDARAAAVVNGTAAAAIVPPPNDARMTARGLKVLGAASEIAPEAQGDVLVVLRRWSTTPANGDALSRFLRAHVRAQEWLRTASNQTDAVTALTQSGASSPAEARSAFDSLTKASAIPVDGAINRPGIAADISLLHGLRGTDRPLADPDRLVDASFLERARR